MISRIRGTLESKKPPFILIDVSGVGYELQVPMSTLYHMPDIGKTVTLLTHFHVREDVQVLFGFFEERERALFRSLIKVSGVGPKMALGILSGMDVATFILCVERKDVAPLVRLPGVGRKTAERLLIEMAGKLAKAVPDEGEFSRKLFEKIEINSPKMAMEEALSALLALGYKPPEAQRALGKIQDENETLSCQELIRKALQGMAKV
jgi:Holliday junction DNA helicase RuvA